MLEILGDEIQDPEEEVFLLFSQDIPSQNLGFVDSKATSVQITVNGKDLDIEQSPTLLTSTRPGGTTGAVLWKITPLIAEWISSPKNPFFEHFILDSKSIVLELGCGTSGVLGLALAPKVKRYIATDQDYVFKILRQNLERNAPPSTIPSTAMSNSKQRQKGKASLASQLYQYGNIDVIALDWELSSVSSLPDLLGDCDTGTLSTVDGVLACDCIYNESLIDPLVQTCIDICRLRSTSLAQNPTVCIIAQQLRSSEIFEAWLSAFTKSFRVWRVQDDLLSADLKQGSGFVIHCGLLRETAL